MIPPPAEMEKTLEQQVVHFVRPISMGGFGKVDLVCCNRVYFAVKYILCPRRQDVERLLIDEETQFLRQMRTPAIPNTVWAVGSALVYTLPAFANNMRPPAANEVYVAIVMPYVSANTLRCQLASLANLGQRCSSAHVSIVMGGLASFSYAMYERRRLSHNDFKLGNVLVNSKWSPTVVDFSFVHSAAVRHTQETWKRGTPCYMAPEHWFFDVPTMWMVNSGNGGTCSVGDTWAMALVWTTMLLTGMPLTDIDDPLLAARVMSPNHVFNPEYTDTVFDLVPVTTPWLHAVLTEILDREKPPPDISLNVLYHGVCLMLWYQALYTGDREVFLPGTDVLPGIEQTPLHVLLSRHARRITELYRQHGHGLLERARDEVKRQLSPTEWHAYLRMFAWNPAHRRGVHDANPFAWLLGVFGANARELDDRLATAAAAQNNAPPPVPDLFFPANSGGLAGLIVHAANDGCNVCKAPCQVQCGICKQKRCSNECLSGHYCQPPVLNGNGMYNHHHAGRGRGHPPQPPRTRLHNSVNSLLLRVEDGKYY